MFTPQVVELAYIGNRPTKTDNVCGTGTVWIGHGDVQKVERKHIPVFLKHPDVWMLADDFAKLGTESAFIPECSEDAPVFEQAQEAETSESEKPAEEKSEKSGDQLAVIKNAILSLEQGNPAHFSSTNGVPVVSAVRNAAGDEAITAADVRAAWAELNGKAV